MFLGFSTYLGQSSSIVGLLIKSNSHDNKEKRGVVFFIEVSILTKYMFLPRLVLTLKGASVFFSLAHPSFGSASGEYDSNSGD